MVDFLNNVTAGGLKVIYLVTALFTLYVAKLHLETHRRHLVPGLCFVAVDMTFQAVEIIMLMLLMNYKAAQLAILIPVSELAVVRGLTVARIGTVFGFWLGVRYSRVDVKCVTTVCDALLFSGRGWVSFLKRIITRKKLHVIVVSGLSFLLYSGCRSTEHAAVTKPETSSVNARTDTVRVTTPKLALPGAGTATKPLEVATYDNLGNPTYEFVEVTFSDEKVTVTSPTKQQTFGAPAHGEILRLYAGTGPADTTDLEAAVVGEPKADTVKLQKQPSREEEQNVLDKLGRLPPWAVAVLIAFGLAALIQIARLFI